MHASRRLLGATVYREVHADPADAVDLGLEPITGSDRHHRPQRAGENDVAGAQRIAQARHGAGQPDRRIERVTKAFGATAAGHFFSVAGHPHAGLAQVEPIETSSRATEYEAAAGRVVSHGIDEADVPALDATAGDFQGRHDPADGRHHVGECGVGAGQVAFEDQRDFSLDLRLQYAAARHGGVVAVAHVGKQGAEVRLVHAQLGLDLGVGQADLAPDHAAPVGHAVVDVEALDGIRGGVVCTDPLTQRPDGFAVVFGLAPVGGGV